MKFVDTEIFGNNFYGFQAKYFHQRMDNPHVWYQTEEDKEAYFNRLKTKSVFLKKEDCVDLPPKVFEVKIFEMDKEQDKHYKNMIKNIQDNINESIKDNYIAYDIIDCNSDMLYAAYYDQEYHKNNKVLQIVNKKLDSIINEMKIRKIIKGDK